MVAEEALESIRETIEIAEGAPKPFWDEDHAEVLDVVDGRRANEGDEIGVVLCDDRVPRRPSMRKQLGIGQAAQLMVLGNSYDVVPATPQLLRHAPGEVLVQEKLQVSAERSASQRASSRSARRLSRSISASISSRKSA